MRAPGIRLLLFVASGLLLAIPLTGLAVLRIYDTALVRQTERQLIELSVMVGEAYRAAWLDESHLPRPAADSPAFRPPARPHDKFVPIEPVLDLAYGVEPPQATTFPARTTSDSPAIRAGARVAPLLERAQAFNLAGVRLLDAEGCVVATSRSDAGACMQALPEVKQALAGAYAAVARERVSDEPLPSVGDVRRRGSVRVFTALPIFHEGRVIGVVRASRTSVDALTSLWANRRGLLFVGGLAVAAALLVSVGLAAWIVRPLRRLARGAAGLSRGALGVELQPGRLAPAEVRALGEALSSMTRRLDERAQAVERFASDASHELKTPLTAIRGAAELLRDGGETMPLAQRQRFVGNILDAALRMDQLVTRMLQLARVEHAEAAVETVVLADFAAELSRRYGERLLVQRSSDAVTLAIAPAQLSSALTNLLDNALRHGAPHPVTLDIRRTSTGRVRFAVTDRGPGISEANQARLFSRFFTTERERGGTGLGLAIVKAIAERRGGEITFETGPQGTTFALVL